MLSVAASYLAMNALRPWGDHCPTGSLIPSGWVLGDLTSVLIVLSPWSLSSEAHILVVPSTLTLIRWRLLPIQSLCLVVCAPFRPARFVSLFLVVFRFDSSGHCMFLFQIFFFCMSVCKPSIHLCVKIFCRESSITCGFVFQILRFSYYSKSFSL